MLFQKRVDSAISIMCVRGPLMQPVALTRQRNNHGETSFDVCRFWHMAVVVRLAEIRHKYEKDGATFKSITLEKGMTASFERVQTTTKTEILKAYRRMT